MDRPARLVGAVLLTAAMAACTTGTAATSARAPSATATAQAVPSAAVTGDLILATTTSTQDSGLLDVLVPAFQDKTGYTVKTVAVGSGQALKMGEEGNADVLLVHSPAAEKALVEAGFGTDRRLVMHNSFLVVGPKDDPAGTRDATAAQDAFAKIAAAGGPFVSRGDDSGTHTKELGIWEALDATPDPAWYIESGQGMGATLQIASEKGGYTLTDIATWLATRDRLELDALVTDDPRLLNPYHVIVVNPARWPKANAAGAAAFADFLLSTEGQQTIGQFGVDTYGEQLFVPDGGKTESDLGLP